MDWKFSSRHTVESMFISNLISRDETQEIQKKWTDTMNSLNQKIQAIIRIPSIRLRLFRIGKQLEWEKMVMDGSIQNTRRLHLVSTTHLRPWQIVDEMISVIYRYFYRKYVPSPYTQIENCMNEFFSMIPKENKCYLEVIRLSFLPELLVSLYLSPYQVDKVFAFGMILHILKFSRIALAKDWRNECACLVLEFCKLLRRVSHEDSLYLSCRSALGLLLKNMDIASWLLYGEDTKGASCLMKEIFSFVGELGNRLCEDLASSTESPWSSGPFFCDVCDFKAFLLPLFIVIKRGPSSDPILNRDYVDAFRFLYATFSKLLRKMDECLLKMQSCFPLNTTWEDVTVWNGWFQHLAILEELHKISELYDIAEEELWMSLRQREFSLCVLLVKYLKPTDDIKWLLEHKNDYGFEFRRQLARQMIPKANEDFQRSLKIVIDKFLNMGAHVEGHQVLPNDLLSQLRVQEESAAGLKSYSTRYLTEKWFLSMCQAIFNPQNALFIACPNDPARLYPNPAIKLENLHLEYFRLAGLADVFGNKCLQKFFFHCLDLEDLDWMMQGIGSSVSPHDLKANAASYRYYSDRRRHVITNWEKGRLLGRGSFGSVYEGYAAGGFFFAVKEVQLLDQGNQENQAKQCIYQIEQEIALLSQFNHPNIVQYYGTDKDETKLYIFLELVSNGSLTEIYSRYHLKDSQVAAYTRQILHGLKYLHEHNVIHRDIKCANILVNVGGTVKLADFGLAKVTEFNNLIKSCKGTPCWMAPEVVNLKRTGGYGLPADIWSLGCTVLEMLIRKPPYSHLEPAQVLYKIGRGEPPPVPDFLSGLSQDFILQCLQVNPDDRPTAAQLLDHPFVKRSSHA
ncbi:E3 ubiquitin-protein ligase UPL5-like isoform X2 [Hevea brasiliensis]|uniref:E3 ubiquitin-protein ligase UPL5-like isoform X2 n=1 Tax=Hevea brasiliensis TaxID=3981 RepID=UPI0025CE0CEC|nr:E3 ubiquitin-protein ligase UPL5-like isoform X2 [Hevea brasiliensis]